MSRDGNERTVTRFAWILLIVFVLSIVYVAFQDQQSLLEKYEFLSLGKAAKQLGNLRLMTVVSIMSTAFILVLVYLGLSHYMFKWLKYVPIWVWEGLVFVVGIGLVVWGIFPTWAGTGYFLGIIGSVASVLTLYFIGHRHLGALEDDFHNVINVYATLVLGLNAAVHECVYLGILAVLYLVWTLAFNSILVPCANVLFGHKMKKSSSRKYLPVTIAFSALMIVMTFWTLNVNQVKYVAAYLPYYAWGANCALIVYLLGVLLGATSEGTVDHHLPEEEAKTVLPHQKTSRNNYVHMQCIALISGILALVLFFTQKAVFPAYAAIVFMVAYGVSKLWDLDCGKRKVAGWIFLVTSVICLTAAIAMSKYGYLFEFLT